MKEGKNIYEHVADLMKENQQKAFLGNPLSEAFFQLNHSTNTKNIGRNFPQTSYINLDFAHQLEFHFLPSNSLIFERIEIYKTSKLTDLISTAAFSAHAYILSKNAVNVFQKFDLGQHKIYPATVYHKDIPHEYGVLHFVTDLQDNLDFAHSSFYVSNILGGFEFDIDIANKEDFEIKQNLVKNGEYPNTKKWWSVGLKWGIWKGEARFPDIFKISNSDCNPYITNKLGQAIFDNKLTGFEIKGVFNLEK
ncbi:hypothetical protein RCC89_03540 [Cytophagaceae bacterium ABcell3]|nr:hypothetical protein RCC89_03540 [Cytophagaceae bacterium ABcell3]